MGSKSTRKSVYNASRDEQGNNEFLKVAGHLVNYASSKFKRKTRQQPPPPPPPPVNNPFYQKFVREYWERYEAGTASGPPPPPEPPSGNLDTKPAAKRDGIETLVV